MVEMKDLEFRIGGLSLGGEKTKMSPYYKFVVNAIGNIISIYVAEEMIGTFPNQVERKHSDIAELFKIPEKTIVGGGILQKDVGRTFVLGGFSATYNAIPKTIAEKFAELLLPELKKSGLKISGISAEPYEEKLNGYWRR